MPIVSCTPIKFASTLSFEHLCTELVSLYDDFLLDLHALCPSSPHYKKTNDDTFEATKEEANDKILDDALLQVYIVPSKTLVDIIIASLICLASDYMSILAYN